MSLKRERIAFRAQSLSILEGRQKSSEDDQDILIECDQMWSIFLPVVVQAIFPSVLQHLDTNDKKIHLQQI